MSEVMRINSVAADTVRTGCGPSVRPARLAGGDCERVPGESVAGPALQHDVAQMSSQGAVALHSLDATGRVGGVRFFASGSYSNDQGAIRELTGQQQRRARVNLDYDLRSNCHRLDQHDVRSRHDGPRTARNFGGLLRGATPGTDYLARDTLGRPISSASARVSRPTGNGAGRLLLPQENERSLPRLRPVPRQHDVDAISRRTG